MKEEKEEGQADKELKPVKKGAENYNSVTNLVVSKADDEDNEPI